MPASPRPTALLLLAALLAAAPGAPPAAGQDAPPKEGPGLSGDEEIKPLTPEEAKAARALFAKAMAYVKDGHGVAARKVFEEFLEKYPGADEDMVREADDRSGDNFLAGIELQHEGGPSARRIDVELMGDGYTLEIFKRFKGDALNQLKPFWAEPLYAEYANYLNVWRFDLVSKENGVDVLTPEEKGMPPPPDDGKPKKPPKPKRRQKTVQTQFSTALDCKAAGPQNQVMANPEQVRRWRRYLKESDGLTIAFANKGALGMGGGGIATTGMNVAVVHEFGHAFVGLLDEYANNPSRPEGGRGRQAANAYFSDDPDPRKPPSPMDVPWAHWLAAKFPGVGIHLGGATYQLGAFRPAPSCAMNSGGGSPMCPVCREEGVLRIYSYIPPLDEYGPLQDRVQMSAGESREFFVIPMKPKTHDIQVDWTIQVLAAAPDPAPPAEVGSYVQDDRAAAMWQRDGIRGAERRAAPLPEGKPKGSPLKATGKKAPTGAIRSTVRVEKLPPGVYRVTARLFDDAKVGGQPWVLKDTDRLREEWRTWIVEVAVPAPRVPAPPPTTPPSPPGPGPGGR